MASFVPLCALATAAFSPTSTRCIAHRAVHPLPSIIKLSTSRPRTTEGEVDEIHAVVPLLSAATSSVAGHTLRCSHQAAIPREPLGWSMVRARSTGPRAHASVMQAPAPPGGSENKDGPILLLILLIPLSLTVVLPIILSGGPSLGGLGDL